MTKKIFGGVFLLSLAASPVFAGQRGIPTVFSHEPSPAAQTPAAEEKTLPPVLLSGLDAYALGGPENAVKAWMKDGPLENDPKVLASAHAFQEVEKYYGAYKGYEVVREKSLTSVSKLVFIQMNYEKGPFFVRFLCYLSGSRWVVAGRLILNTDPSEILPSGS